METTSPLVTVILPTYNAGASLRAAVESILGQTYANIELLLIDDGSTDNSTDFVQHLPDKRLRIIRQANMGLAATLNRGIRESTGDLIARMDADDVSHRDRIAAQVVKMLSDRSIVLLGGQIRRMSDGHVMSTSRFPTGHEAIVNGLLGGSHVISHPTVMFRRDAVTSIGAYWEHGLSEDWDLFLKLSTVGQLSNLQAPVLDYQYHLNSINSRSLREVRTNIRLSIHNYHLRSRGLRELNPQEFLRQLPPHNMMGLWCEVLSLRMYRAHLNHWANRRRIRSLACLAGSAALWPKQALKRIKDSHSSESH